MTEMDALRDVRRCTDALVESIDELKYHVEGCAVRMDKLIHAIRRRSSMIEEGLFDEEERISRIVDAYGDPMDRLFGDEELTEAFCGGCPRRYEPIDGPMDCDITPRHAD
ncbi:MAG: hypothetical protein IJR14_01685, partial [Synergistaceae bacterium]|nr:hypothetical protein [Synergistaceae bacterium]